MNQIYATFSNPKMAELAAGALLDHGVREEHLSIIFPEAYHATTPAGRIADEGPDHHSSDPEHAAKHGITTTTPQDAASGAAKGAGIGAGVGAAAALASLLIPGFGLVLGGGALAIALAGTAGATAAGAVAGGVTGYLKDQGVPADAVEVYNGVLTSGGALLTVTDFSDDLSSSQIEALIQKYEGAITARPALAQDIDLRSHSRTL